ncbi:cytochrome P450 [Streptomyces sp. NPDC059009]|uniref:cytochrome P450 n=1 Tax=Streptomyces sp. NPDC059009 TaxID=3346694 RepID=UPI00369366E4
MRTRTPAIRARAAEVLDRLPQDADWVQDFCMPYTVHVIADLLGVPDTDHDTITRWDTLLTSLATGAELTAETVTAYLDFTQEFTEYFRDRAAHLADHPDGSLLSHLIQEGDNLTDHERIQFLLILFPAGSTTTVILLTHIAMRLAAQPDVIAELRADPAARPDFIEECLVERSPSANVFRTTTRDVVLQNTPIPAGAHLLLLVAAANQDIPDRSAHLAFGHGVHRCLGAQLARTEARAALDELLARYGHIALRADPSSLPVRPHLLIPAYERLPIRLERPS